MYSPGPISLIIARDRSGNRSGSAAFSLIRNSSSAFESGLSGSLNSVFPCDLDNPFPSFWNAYHTADRREFS